MAYVPLHDRLRGPIRDALKKELKIENIHALPRVAKVIVNVGINKMKMDSKELQEYIVETLKQITGQKPVLRKTRKAISNFKTRKGLVVGVMVTLRGRKMEEFLDRLLSVVLPRIRDFRGLPTKLDGQGNYAIGLKDHTIFPEVPAIEAGRIFGMQIQITTTAKDDRKGRALLKELGVPFTPERKHTEPKKTQKEAVPAVDKTPAVSDT
ncbi:MAG: 50S ribosomal protein L5 [Candidatus Peregrinibacteria bacterium]|nr:50S ribosomal protein L5 [Candidatus Peregrinibacteria bacterium]